MGKFIYSAATAAVAAASLATSMPAFAADRPALTVGAVVQSQDFDS